MRQFFCLLILAISFVSVDGSVRIKPKYAPDQYSWEEHAAANLWLRSESLNRELLKWNRGYIYPGDWLLLAYPQAGDSLWAPVKKGDYPLKISKRVIIEQPQKYNYSGDNDKVGNNDSKPSAFSMLIGSEFLTKFWQALKKIPTWFWILLIIAAGGYAIMILKGKEARKVNRVRNSNPITAGNPQVLGGVPDTGAHQRFVEIAKERFPSATFVVKKMYRGVLNGPAIVCYKGEPSQEKILKNIDAYEGVTLINGREESIFFLQPCGNDARRGDFMKDGGKNQLIFTRQFEILTDGTEIPVDADGNRIVTETSEVVEEKVEVVPPAPEKKVIHLSPQPAPSEFYKVVSDHNFLAGQILKDKSAHRVTIKVTTSEGTVETIYEAKVEMKQKNESEGAKK